MIVRDPGKTITRHQQLAAEKSPPILRPKKCACGTNITARQLDQYGKCDVCALTASLKPGDLEKLRHMLGATDRYPKSKWGFRNHYCCGMQDWPAMSRMVQAGLVRSGDSLLSSLYFHATALGCRAAGLGAAGIRRALGVRP